MAERKKKKKSVKKVVQKKRGRPRTREGDWAVVSISAEAHRALRITAAKLDQSMARTANDAIIEGLARIAP